MWSLTGFSTAINALVILGMWVPCGAYMYPQISSYPGYPGCKGDQFDHNNTAGHRLRDCIDLPHGSKSGVYSIWLDAKHSINVYCDMDTNGGGWTVFQRRDNILPRTNFTVGWEQYKKGFGSLTGEFWLGNENLWLLTKNVSRKFELRIDLEDFDGQKRYAVYEGFRVYSEPEGYRLQIGNYSGDAGDSMKNHMGQKFTTIDRDNDGDSGNCAILWKGGWWYRQCHHVNLNGQYFDKNPSPLGKGLNWSRWKGYEYSLKKTEMKLRPQEN